jgi:hypothetical protein
MKYTLIFGCVLFVLNSCTYTKGSPEPAITYIPDINYRDIPDAVIQPNDSLALDVDMDLKADVMIYGEKTSYITSSGSSGAHYAYYFTIKAIHPNSSISCGSQTNNQFSNFGAGMPVSQSSRWENKAYLRYHHLTSSFGYWDLFPSGGYIGVELRSGSDKRYAWVRLKDSIGTSNLKVYEFAINRDPNQPINAGQKQ